MPRKIISASHNVADRIVILCIPFDHSLEDRLKALTHQISDANLKQMPEFHQRVDVLRNLEYVSPDNIVQMKV